MSYEQVPESMSSYRHLMVGTHWVYMMSGVMVRLSCLRSDRDAQVVCAWVLHQGALPLLLVI